eukprot:TRINITY_DN11252_c0_g1_i1.p1 TRINITY_DN11252_c0_g1~~TRINITY_DN11252_c0_g1_i1.p1  ORF type:complete len:147 (-),score=22.98 TRINITY_DN11252_c0_g1_i1:73-513(-)
MLSFYPQRVANLSIAGQISSEVVGQLIRSFVMQHTDPCDMLNDVFCSTVRNATVPVDLIRKERDLIVQQAVDKRMSELDQLTTQMENEGGAKNVPWGLKIELMQLKLLPLQKKITGCGHGEYVNFRTARRELQGSAVCGSRPKQAG